MSTASLPCLSPSRGRPDCPHVRLASAAATVPVSDTADGTGAALSRQAARPAHTVLLVEDNADDAELALLGLRGCGVGPEVKWLRDGAEAMEWIGAGGIHTLRLVLLDLRMPRMDGFEVLRRLKSEPTTRAIPVIIMASAHGTPELDRCFELGADAYLVKPLESEPLRATLRDLRVRLGNA